MRLSPNKVYKKPPICGNCSYSAGNVSGNGINKENLEQQDSLVVAEHRAARGEVSYWVEPKQQVKENKGDSLVSGLENLDETLSEKAEQTEKASAVKSDYVDKQQVQEEAKRTAEKILEERMQDCLREGYEQGKAKAEDECCTMRESAAAKLKDAELSLREAKQRYKEIIASSETKIVELSLAVAERLVYKQLEIAPDTVKAIVRETMNMLNGGEQVDLYVNPEDLDLCRQYGEQLKEEFADIVKLEILSDSKLARGSCRIESENGVAEYLLEEEKEQLKEMLMNLARKEEKEAVEEEDSSYGKH